MAYQIVCDKCGKTTTRYNPFNKLPEGFVQVSISTVYTIQKILCSECGYLLVEWIEEKKDK